MSKRTDRAFVRYRDRIKAHSEVEEYAIGRYESGELKTFLDAVLARLDVARSQSSMLRAEIAWLEALSNELKEEDNER